MEGKATFTCNGVGYEFDFGTLSVSEAMVLKNTAGLGVLEWHESLSQMDAEAVRALVWIAAKRSGTPIEGKYSEFDFDLLALAQSLEVESDAADPTVAAPNRAARRSTKKSSSTPR